MTDPTPTPQTPPQGLTDAQLLELMPQQFQDDLATVSRLAAYGMSTEPGIYRVSLNTGALAFARAAIAARPQPVPVPVAERPWERPGWCDTEGRCWWGRCADDFFNPEWTMATLANIEEFCSDAMPQHCLPHWAIPQPPQVNTTHPIPTEPPTDD